MKKSLKGIIAVIVSMFAFLPVAFASTVTVTFDTNGGSSIEPIEMESGSTLVLPADPTKEDNTFMGWYMDEDLIMPYNSVYSINSDTTIYAKWISNDKIIKNVSVTVSASDVGTKIGDDTKPTIVLDDNANYTLGFTTYINDLPSNDPTYDDGSIFGTTIEDGKDYYVEVFLKAKDGYMFDIDNLTLKVNSTTDYELGYSSNDQVSFYTKVTAGETTEVEYQVLDGADQEYDATASSKLTFRFSIDYAEFKDSGKVYMDGEIVDSSNYETKEGSTIVTFTKAYTDLLAAGKHTVKVTTANGEVSTSFTITKSVKNPNTGDDIINYIITLVISAIGLAGAGLYIKKKNYN